MKHPPLVSVIIPCFNNAHHMTTSIRSVLDQSYASVECIVVDDGSTDNTADLVRNIAEADPRVKYFRKTNGGVGSARNYGVRNSFGEILQFLDADDWLEKTKLDQQVAFARESGLLGKDFLIYCDYTIISFNGEGKPVRERKLSLKHHDKEVLKEALMERKFGLETPQPLHVANVLMTKRIAETMPFREDMKLFEEFDFFWRVLSSDIPIVYTPVNGFYYRDDGQGISKNASNHKVGYLQFLEAVSHYDPVFLKLSPNLGTLITYFSHPARRTLLKRTMNVVRNGKIPIRNGAGKNLARRWLVLDNFGLSYPYAVAAWAIRVFRFRAGRLFSFTKADVNKATSQ